MSHPITFERLRHLGRVREFFRDGRVYDAAGGDDAPGFEHFAPHPDPRIWYIEARDETSPGQGAIALFTAIPRSRVLWEIHVTRAFGAGITEAARAIAPFLFRNTPARRVIAEIPETNRAAIRLAQRAGYVFYGRNPQSYEKHGRLVDQILLGVSA